MSRLSLGVRPHHVGRRSSGNKIMLSYFQRQRERQASEHLCKQFYPLVENLCRNLYPNEPIFGCHMCADEPQRWVVRIYYGKRERSEYLGPPWHDCLIVGIDKSSSAIELIEDVTPYLPKIR